MSEVIVVIGRGQIGQAIARRVGVEQGLVITGAGRGKDLLAQAAAFRELSSSLTFDDRERSR
jgi:predicted dinucleotide-binding enzyme